MASKTAWSFGATCSFLVIDESLAMPAPLATVSRKE
jgi:hypothetical protein